MSRFVRFCEKGIFLGGGEGVYGEWNREKASGKSGLNILWCLPLCNNVGRQNCVGRFSFAVASTTRLGGRRSVAFSARLSYGPECRRGWYIPRLKAFCFAFVDSFVCQFRSNETNGSQLSPHVHAIYLSCARFDIEVFYFFLMKESYSYIQAYTTLNANFITPYDVRAALINARLVSENTYMESINANLLFQWPLIYLHHRSLRSKPT